MRCIIAIITQIIKSVLLFRSTLIDKTVLISIVVIISTASSCTCEESLSTADFAYGFTLNLGNKGAIYRIEISDALYKGVIRQDLGDIRIFNGSGEVIPHFIQNGGIVSSGELVSDNKTSISDYNAISQEQTTQKSLSYEQTKTIVGKSDLPFFPLYNENQADEDSDISMSVIHSADGTVIRVDSFRQSNISIKRESNIKSQTTNERQQAQDSTVQDINGYLLDMNKVKPYPKSLEVEWIGGSDNFVINVILQGSNDLTYWDYITEKSLAKFNFSGNSIYENILPLKDGASENSRIKNLPKYRYLRLSWPAAEQASTAGAELSKITAIFPEHIKTKKREWRELSNGNFSQSSRMEINFDSQGFFPVDAVQIKFNQINSIIRATVESASELGDKWQYRCAGLFYNLMAAISGLSEEPEKSVTSELTNRIFTFYPTSDRFWRIKVQQDGAGLESAVSPPVLKIGFIPGEILFIARGNPPYTLAYGSVKAFYNSDNQGIPDTILRAVSIKEISEASYGAPVILGGEAALKIPPPPLPWKTWILWASLIGGVAFIGFMVWSLARQMKSRS